jgi:hypothetical protein
MRLLHAEALENRNLCIGLANSIGSLSSYLGASGRFSEAEDLVKEVAELQARHLDAELREAFAKTLGNYRCQLAGRSEMVKSEEAP